MFRLQYFIFQLRANRLCVRATVVALFCSGVTLDVDLDWGYSLGSTCMTVIVSY